MSVFSIYDPAVHTTSSLVNALLATSSGLVVNTSSFLLKSGSDGDTPSLSFYDGTLSALGIGAGLLLTSGNGAPPLTNTASSYTVGLYPSETDTDLSVVVHNAFPSAGDVQDATVLQFQFTVSDPTLHNIQFDLLFGSDEYPEYSDSTFVDVAGVYVNGVNYALFNNNTANPLSILDPNLASGNFRDNTGGTLPIEYDGISNKLTIVAPVVTGTNTIKIGVADTGDQAYDSGLFVSNLRAVGYTGSGLALETTGTSGTDLINGNAFNDVIDLGTGDDLVNGGLGDDLLIGGLGFDAAFFSAELSKYLLTPSSNGITFTGPDGVDVLVDIEFGLFGSSLYALNTQTGGTTYGIYALLLAAFDSAPSTALLSQWVATSKKQGITDLGDLGQLMIDTWAPGGLSNELLITHLYYTVAGLSPSAEDIATFSALIGPGNTFGTQGDLFAFAALLDPNIVGMTSIIGQPLALDLSYFV